MFHSLFLYLLAFCLLGNNALHAFKHQSQAIATKLRTNVVSHRFDRSVTRLLSVNSNDQDKIKQEENNDEEIIKKYGLEAGLLQAATSKNKKVSPKDLLAKYGVAYLATSITLAIISYALCYVMVANGIDVAALLEKVGIQSTAVAANTGTAAIAYAMHKAASPIRFPPTVALTPIVAGWLGKKPKEDPKNSKP